MKILKRTLIVVVLVVVVLLLVLQFLLGPIVKKTVEGIGPKVAGVPITVAKVHTSLVRGYAEIDDLVIGNPPGFKTPHAIKLGQLVVDVRMTSLLRSPLVVDRVLVKDPEIVYEQTLQGNNIGKIIESLGGTNAAPSKPAAPEKKDDKGKNAVIITDLRVEGARMRIGTGIGSSTVLIPLPPVQLTDLGKETGGTSVREVVGLLLSSATRAGGDVAGRAGDTAKAIGRGAKETGAATVDAVGKGVGKAVNAVTGLLKKE